MTYMTVVRWSLVNAQAEGQDELSMKFWVVAIVGANVPILGPLFTQDHF